jgi:hypothetical protein
MHKDYDEYVIRGGYSTCSGSNLLYYGDTVDYNIETQQKYLPEYLRVRPYFSQNFYALTEPSKNRDVWCASQYHNPDTDEGMIQVFKREFSSILTCQFDLHEIDESATYILEDIDEGTTEISGACLKNFTLTIKEKRVAKIFIYKKK